MKRPEYVAAVTHVYREALDTGRVTKDMKATLTASFNRQGFTDGYYTGRTGSHMFGVRESTREDPAFLKQARLSYEAVENGLVPITMEAQVRLHGSKLTVSDPEGRTVTIDGPVPEQARVAELTREVLRARLAKTGGTPYRCLNVKAIIEPGLMLSASAINSMRRDALNALTAQRARRDLPKPEKPQRISHVPGPKTRPVFTFQVTGRQQITEKMLRMNPALLYVPLHILAGDPAFCQELMKRVKVCAVLPRIVHDGEVGPMKEVLRNLRGLGLREVLVTNLGQLIPVRECRMHARGDFGLNLYNSAAVNTARELELRSACLSFEMTLPQIRDVSKAVPCELLIYGRMPLMVTENCLIRGRTGQCTCNLGPTKLTDKIGAEFPIIKDGASCRSVLLNGKKLNWLDRQSDLYKLGLWAGRLYFTTENPKEVDLVLDQIHAPCLFEPGACTRGLYLRGLE